LTPDAGSEEKNPAWANDPQFYAHNAVSLMAFQKIESVYKHMGDVGLALFINAHVMFIKTLSPRVGNVMLVMKRGCAKTSMLNAFLRHKDMPFKQMNPKSHEYTLIQKGKAFFNNNIIINTDYTTTVEGVNKQQYERMNNFIMQLSSDGYYMRDGLPNQSQKPMKLLACRTGFFLAIAEKPFKKHWAEFYASTVMDRFLVIGKGHSDAELMEILDVMHEKYAGRNNSLLEELPFKVPKFKGKERGWLKRIGYDDRSLKERLNLFVIDLAQRNGGSRQRTLEALMNFLMANAYLNGRDMVTNYDLDLMESLWHVFTYHFDENDEMRILFSLRNYPDMDEQSRLNDLGMSRASYYRKKASLQKKGLLDALKNFEESNGLPDPDASE